VIFGHTLALIRDVDPEVPMMIGETAVGPKTGHQAADIRNLFAGIRRNHLLGLIWFNKPQHRKPYIYHQDWRLQDHMAAEQAFVAELKAMGQPVETFVEPGHRS